MLGLLSLLGLHRTAGRNSGRLPQQVAPLAGRLWPKRSAMVLAAALNETATVKMRTTKMRLAVAVTSMVLTMMMVAVLRVLQVLQLLPVLPVR